MARTRMTRQEMHELDARVLLVLDASGGAMSSQAVCEALSVDWERSRDAVARRQVLASLARLAKAGRVMKDIRREFDRQRSAHASGFFGGAGVCQRHRAYWATPKRT